MKRCVTILAAVFGFWTNAALASDVGHIRPYVSAIAGYDSTAVGYAISGGVEGDVNDMFIIGADFEIGDSDLSRRFYNRHDNRLSVNLSAGRDLYAGAKVAVRITEPLTLYLKSGYTNAKVHGSIPVNDITLRNDISQHGYRLGGGIELGTGHLRFLAEYRYSDYGLLKYKNINTAVYLRRSQAMGGLKYAF